MGDFWTGQARNTQKFSWGNNWIRGRRFRLRYVSSLGDIYVIVYFNRTPRLRRALYI
jgi:hypothetical protein